MVDKINEQQRCEKCYDMLNYAMNENITISGTSVHFGYSKTYLKNYFKLISKKYEKGKILNETELCFKTAYEQYSKKNKITSSRKKQKKSNYLNESNILLNADKFGQIFTTSEIVNFMISLIKNKDGKTLEPSAGDGAFSKKLNCVSIELDSKFRDLHTYNMDFFDYPITNKYDTIIGNPPYVKFNDILDNTKDKLDLTLFDKRTNLYLFFIYKCIQHLNDNGEIIFITPVEFVKSTASIKLNSLIYDIGTITHFYDYGDKMVFPGFSPNVVVWRFEKNNFSRLTNTFNGVKKFNNFNGQLIFSDNEYSTDFNDLFFVKVGGVSGLDKIFSSEEGNEEFVCSYTRTNGHLRKMFYNFRSEYLEKHKDLLLTRQMKQFNETDWWKWGRDFYHSDKDRIYVNCKTRVNNPFFTNECKNYDGSVLAIFPKKDDIDIKKAVTELNNIKWEDLGFKIGGRYVFSQKSLSNIKLSDDFYDKIKKNTQF